MSCEHEELHVDCVAHRLKASEEDPTIIGFNLDIHVTCRDCGEPFVFLGPPVGQHPNEPTISVDATELRAPIRPASDLMVRGGLAGFRVSFKEQRLARERADA